MFPCFPADLTSVFCLCGGQWHSGCVQMMVQISWNQWTQPQFIFFLPEGEKPAAETHRGVLDSRHSDTCWSNICIELFSLLSSFIFCSIKVISCKLNTSLLSYWLNEAQLKKVSYCRLTRREVFFFYPPKNVQNMSSILHKKLQTLTSGRDITNLFASCRLWVTDVGSDVIWVKATDHILFNSTKLFF